MTSQAAAKVNIGDKIKEQFSVRKKIGEGACGTVYLVQSIKTKNMSAMKVEPTQKCKDDEILKMEVYVMKKLQQSKHVCKLLLSGRNPTYSFVIMSLLGKELADLRRRMPDRKMSLATVLRVGIQCFEAIQDVHTAGFIHRDIKPTNFACGHTHKHIIYLFDFGLARQIFLTDKDGKMKLREPRNKVCFRGTVRYCSVNVHLYKEQGRHDDLISLLYMLIELLTATLPWKGQLRREAGHLKETVSDSILLKGCPPSFYETNNQLKKMTYFDNPPYEAFRESFKKDVKQTKVKLNEPFEWEKEPAKKGKAAAAKKDEDEIERSEKKQRIKKADEQAEIEGGPDTDTIKDLDDSVLTDGEDVESQTKGLAKEDTLDNVAEMSKRNG